MKTLLSGAKAVPPTEILRKDYVKFGGEKRALKDFYSVKPKNIHTLGEDSIVCINLTRGLFLSARVPPSFLLFQTLYFSNKKILYIVIPIPFQLDIKLIKILKSEF